MSGNQLNSRWCECDNPKPELLEDVKLSYWCRVCDNPIPCEVCEWVADKDADVLQATVRHVDYYVCKKHLMVAISNVHS